jgi:hypothetical protein
MVADCVALECGGMKVIAAVIHKTSEIKNSCLCIFQDLLYEGWMIGGLILSETSCTSLG